MRRSWGAVVVAASIIATLTIASAHKEVPAKLKPGHAATVRKAQHELVNGPAVWLVAGASVVGGIALAVSGGHNHTPAATTTSTPSASSSTSTTGTSGG